METITAGYDIQRSYREADDSAKTIGSREWSKDVTYYVSAVRGDGGADWGYTRDFAEAVHLSTYWARRFAADCRRVGSLARFTTSK